MPRIQTNDIETYYERRGSGPPVVFVHGAVVDFAQWVPQLDALADEYTCIAYDVRGHGRTGGSAQDRYSIDLFVDDLEALVAGLALDRPAIVGLSMGGLIAQAYAARHPADVAALVLAGTFTPAFTSRLEWLQRSVLLRATVLPARLVGYQRVERAMLWLQRRIEGEAVSGDYERIEALREDAPQMAAAEFAKVVRAVARAHHLRIDYDAIAAPTLVLHGEHEPGFIKRQSERLAERIEDARLEVVPDASHASNLDNPDWFTEAVREHLGALPMPTEGAATA